jgi:glycosyltransferase involved in cell wall biosynthesis
VRFCFLTSFFGEHSFGGDAIFVERLARALLARGHAVTVVHCLDAWRLLRAGRAPRPFDAPPGLVTRGLETGIGWLSPLITHQGGHPGPKWPALRSILAAGSFDVIHVHNLSLIGGPALLPRLVPFAPVRIMTAHEYWLICPLSLLFKMGKEACREPECLRCTLRAGRPPQLWRLGSALERCLRSLDAMLVPSGASRALHRQRGISTPIDVLPYFLPDGWPPARRSAAAAPSRDRPYVVLAGRLVREKGFDRVLPLAARLPWLDFVVAGDGPERERLRTLAAALPNVRLLGWLDEGDLGAWLAGALATVIPSLFPETFGYVALEAFAMGSPVLARRLGALPELLDTAGAGALFDDEAELPALLERLRADAAWRAELAANGRRAVAEYWSEESHVARYLGMVARLSRAPLPVPPPQAANPAAEVGA